MKIALVHSSYSDGAGSGENVVVESQAHALSDCGHDVALLSRITQEMEKQPLYSLRSGVRVASGFGESPLEEIKLFNPDIVHVHNLFPNFGSRWLNHWTGPIVATLHNYRALCAAATLYREGQVCTACPSQGSQNSLRHACYRRSRLATLPLMIATRRGGAYSGILRRADRLIALSQRTKNAYREYSRLSLDIDVVPNFTMPSGIGPRVPCTDGWLFVGRLAEEKGILDLLRNWPRAEQLDIIGDGPLRRAVCNAVERSDGNINFKGSVPNETLKSVLPRYTGLIIPSRWFEGLPTIYLEAVAHGLPVISSSGSAAADCITSDGTGTVLPKMWLSEDLNQALARVRAERSAMALAGLSAYERRYSIKAWQEAVHSTYRRAIAARSGEND